ncbi:MAG: insulinase family protein [Clostridia bacterium]|nr:insulinase family protein [Clostridia bacterium]
MAEIVLKENKMLGEKYYSFKHKTGLDVYVFPKKMTTSYALFATKYGAIDNKFKLAGESEYTEVPDGIAHFLEHKMFECEGGVDAFELYAKTGASANAYTSNAMTAYLFSSTEKFYESLEILLDFVTHPYFTETTVQKEQGIIGQEIRMYDDHPGARLEKGLLQAMYKYNKMRIDVAGTVESIAQIDADVLYKCYNTFYNLRNMVLVVCGDIEVVGVEKICDKILKEAPNQEIIRAYDDENEPTEVYEKRAECELSVSKPIFAIGIKDMDISNDPEQRMKKAYAMNILNDILFSQSSEFYNELYERNLISHDLSYAFEHTKRCSFNQISSESQNPEKVYEFFVAYIKKMQQRGIDREDFELAKRTIYASCIKSFDSTEDIANNMVYNLFDGADILDAPDIISSIDFEYVSLLLSSMFKEEYYAMSVVNPIGKEQK